MLNGILWFSDQQYPVHLDPKELAATGARLAEGPRLLLRLMSRLPGRAEGALWVPLTPARSSARQSTGRLRPLSDVCRWLSA